MGVGQHLKLVGMGEGRLRLAVAVGAGEENPCLEPEGVGP